jgi:hypothetical protein
MVLSNYWKWLNACNTINQSDQTPVDVGMKSTAGDAATIMFDSTGTKNYLIADVIAPAIGAGTNTYVKGDYALKDDITSDFSNLAISLNSNADDSLSRIVTVQGLNNAAEAKTISEIGIVKTIYAAPNGSVYKPVLLAICQLSAPIVVEAGATFQITIQWTEA